MEWGSGSGANSNITGRNDMQLSDSDMYNSINFIKTYLCNFIKIFPNIILKQRTYNDINISLPKYWGLTSHDKQKMQNFIIDYYVSLNNYYGNQNLENILFEVQDTLNSLLEIINETPIMSNINTGFKNTDANSESDADESNIFGIFDKKTGFYLFENYFLTVLNNYISIANRKEINKKPVKVLKKSLEDVFSTEFNASVEIYVDDEYSGYSEQISENQQKEIKNHVALLLVSYLNIMENHKLTVNLSYDFIMNNVFKIQQSEKGTFTDKLERLSVEAREVDTVLKIHKLGNWNKGMQKSLTTYNKNNDDDESRIQNEKYQMLEKELLKNNNVNEQNIEQYMDDYLAEEEANKANDRAELGLANIDEDYYDGNPYGEENNED